MKERISWIVYTSYSYYLMNSRNTYKSGMQYLSWLSGYAKFCWESKRKTMEKNLEFILLARSMQALEPLSKKFQIELPSIEKRIDSICIWQCCAILSASSVINYKTGKILFKKNRMQAIGALSSIQDSSHNLTRGNLRWTSIVFIAPNQAVMKV